MGNPVIHRIGKVMLWTKCGDTGRCILHIVILKFHEVLHGLNASHNVIFRVLSRARREKIGDEAFDVGFG